ncbi:hypothetical protein [Gottschalkia purinilytica]|uniref:hypothetical protein n=1 Tax=Gottschalkia purinilytica TaxID=1503 RepID=UPI00067CA5DA|nr:hypothetical protein [Gottschalkia purinilytica]
MIEIIENTLVILTLFLTILNLLIDLELIWKKRFFKKKKRNIKGKKSPFTLIKYYIKLLKKYEDRISQCIYNFFFKKKTRELSLVKSF